MMTTCPHCDKARAGSWSGFDSRCTGCLARVIAQGPQFFEYMKDGKILKPYRAQLAAAGVTHEQAKAWFDIVTHTPLADHR